jgi:cytochrome c oxidase accessory protein FixG
VTDKGQRIPPGKAAENEKFRDSISIVTKSGGRHWIFPKQTHGFYTRLRSILSGILLLILFATPFVRINGHPFMLFNIVERKFIIAGTIFGPHDFYLLGLAVITAIVFVVLFTVVFGRLFCGWICPQTVLMEMVFRRIDYWVEGDHRHQRRLAESPWNGWKLRRKLPKYALYALLSFVISNILLAYVIGSDKLLVLVTDPPREHLAGLTAMLAFSGVFYWIFSWFREQACILVCPYGRLQGVLLDKNSIVIAYDSVRGEPRGKRKQSEEPTAGDCIDCGQCVEVCPTGIDIRNGTQLECVNCTACLDACDAVMDAVKKPRNLIRYDSATGIASQVRTIWTPRVVGYSIVLVVLLSILGVLLWTRTDVDVTVLRTPGMFYQEQPDGSISNVYDVKALNKTFNRVLLTLRLGNAEGEVRLIGDELSPEPQGIAEAKLIIILPRERITAISTPLSIEVLCGGVPMSMVSTTFLGPPARHHQ